MDLHHDIFFFLILILVILGVYLPLFLFAPKILNGSTGPWFGTDGSPAPCGPAEPSVPNKPTKKKIRRAYTFFSRKTATSIVEVWVSVASIVRGAERTWTFSKPHMRSPKTLFFMMARTLKK